MATTPSYASTIPLAVFEAARVHASRTAVEDGAVKMTYEQLAGAVQTAAGAFMVRGLQRGDRVAIWAPNSLNWIIAALGAQAAGGVLVPLNTRFKGPEAAYILNRSAARFLCTVSGFLGTDYISLIKGQTIPTLESIVLLDRDGEAGWGEFLSAQPREADVLSRMASVTGDDLSDIIFTSGTTGAPKGAMTAHAQNTRMYQDYAARFGLRAGDRYLIVNPFFHTFGYKAGWFSAFLRGVTVLPHAVFDVEAVLRRISADRISVLPGPPTLYQSLLATPALGQHDISSLRLAITGSSTIPPELIRRMRRELGFERVLTAYGLSETGGVVTMCSADDDEETIATTSGRVIDGIELRITSDMGMALRPGAAGEVLVRGYCIMRGYFGDELATQEAIDSDGWLHTGDIGVMRADGCLSITGRKKDMFIVGGFNCYPAEIENILHNHPAVAQAAVLGVPDERLGEVGKAFIVLRPGHTVTRDALIAWSRENMANFKVPRIVEFAERLPTNAAGKVQKDDLQRWNA